MNVPDKLKYTNEHEWIRLEEDGNVTIGISDFAQGELGEIVYVEVDTVGDSLEKDEVFGTVEAVKTTSELFMPIAGEVVEFNGAISEDEGDDPGLINSDPYTDGWIVKIKPDNVEDLEDLLDAEAYKEMIS